MDVSTVIECILGVVVSAVFGVMSYSIKRNISQLDRELRDMQKEVHDAQLEITKRKDELADFKLHVAENHVTQDELSKSVDRVDSSVRALGELLKEQYREVSSAMSALRDKLEQKADR